MTGSGGPFGANQNLSVVPDDVQQVGRLVYGIADTMKQALDSAVRDVAALLTSGWSGDAAKEFAKGWTETSEAGPPLMRDLTALAEKLGVTAANYRSTDTRSASAIASLNLP